MELLKQSCLQKGLFVQTSWAINVAYEQACLSRQVGPNCLLTGLFFQTAREFVVSSETCLDSPVQSDQSSDRVFVLLP